MLIETSDWIRISISSALGIGVWLYLEKRFKPASVSAAVDAIIKQQKWKIWVAQLLIVLSIVGGLSLYLSGTLDDRDWAGAGLLFFGMVNLPVIWLIVSIRTPGDRTALAIGIAAASESISLRLYLVLIALSTVAGTLAVANLLSRVD